MLSHVSLVTVSQARCTQNYPHLACVAVDGYNLVIRLSFTESMRCSTPVAQGYHQAAIRPKSSSSVGNLLCLLAPQDAKVGTTKLDSDLDSYFKDAKAKKDKTAAEPAGAEGKEGEPAAQPAAAAEAAAKPEAAA